jgi:hypothetical protein
MLKHAMESRGGEEMKMIQVGVNRLGALNSMLKNLHYYKQLVGINNKGSYPFLHSKSLQQSGVSS